MELDAFVGAFAHVGGTRILTRARHPNFRTPKEVKIRPPLTARRVEQAFSTITTRYREVPPRNCVAGS
jgi:hypothetical protein